MCEYTYTCTYTHTYTLFAITMNRYSLRRMLFIHFLSIVFSFKFLKKLFNKFLILLKELFWFDGNLKYPFHFNRKYLKKNCVAFNSKKNKIVFRKGFIFFTERGGSHFVGKSTSCMCVWERARACVRACLYVSVCDIFLVHVDYVCMWHTCLRDANIIIFVYLIKMYTMWHAHANTYACVC